MVNTAITPLDPSECAGKENDKKMSKDLKSAYEIAQQGHDLDHFREVLQQAQEELKEWMEQQAKLEAEQAEKAALKAKEKEDKEAAKESNKDKKKSRKSKGGEDDEMDVDAPEGEAKPSKKRKKDADSEGEAPKVTGMVKIRDVQLLTNLIRQRRHRRP